MSQSLKLFSPLYLVTPVFGIGSVIYTGIEIGVHLEPGLGCVEVTTVLRYNYELSGLKCSV